VGAGPGDPDLLTVAARRLLDQADINRRLVELVRSRNDVVRLKGGDPFVFGRGAEELLALAAAGVEVHVVPGITAGIAGPAAFGIPVTHRGLSSSVAFVTGAQEPGVSSGPDWASLARIDTLVVYMGGRSAAAIAERLVAAGREATTPAAVIVAATTVEARIRITDLAGLAADGAPERAACTDPVLLVIGEVVRVHDAVAGSAAGPLAALAGSR
jgi:uroporphyrin-III C-methyltransferase